MDFINTAISDKNKKPSITLKAILSESNIDKKSLKKHLLENFKIIPQEDRLVVWKIMLDIPIQYNTQNSNSKDLLNNHYDYLKHIIKDVLNIEKNNDVYLNYNIYLLDYGRLPLNHVKYKKQIPFCLLYQQISEIIDDATESEYYYLTVQIYEYLSKNLNKMKERLYEYFCRENDNLSSFIKSIIEHERIKFYFLTAFAFKFHNLVNYLIILDRLVLDSCEILTYILIIIIERIRDHQLASILDSNDYIDEQLGLDESRIKKGIEKLSKLFNANTNTSK